MSLQSLAARARIEGIRALQQTVDRLRRPIRPPSGADLYLVRTSTPHGANDSVWWSLDDPELPDANGLDADGLDADGLDANGLDANGLDANGLDANGLDAEEASAHAPADDGNITKSLDRVAATVDRLSAQLDAY